MIDSLKKHKYIYAAILLVSVIIGGTFLMANAQDEAGKISLEKSATKVYEETSEDNLEKGRFAQVTLDVNAKSYDLDAKTKLDVVLVMDNSSSMDKKDANPSKTLSRRQAAKDAATDFVGKLINEGKDNVKIGMVVFGTDIQSTQQLSSNKTTINDFISGISSIYNQGTNVQAGIAKANELLTTGRTDAKKAVIILTDGEPTYFNYTYTYYSHGTKVTKIKSAGNGNNNETVGVCYEENRSGICTDYRWVKPSQAAKAELDLLKSAYSAADVYTIAFGSQSGNSLSEINPASSEGATPIYVNYSALTGDELKAKFDGISDSLVELIGKDSVVTDVIPKEFKLTESAKTKLIEQGIDVVENEDGTTTLTWDIGNINANTDYKITYEVKAEDDYYGSIYTNKSASLTTTVDDNNPYYKDEENKTITLEFEKPNVAIPMITKDDHYSEKTSYVGYAESTINGESVLDNDLNENLMTDGNVNVSDKVIIVENDNTKKVSENTYEISKDGVKQGVLTMNNDGTFTFVSEENISGEVEFLYHVETTLNPSVETNKVVSRDSKVTLNILSRSKVNVSGKKIWDDSNNQDGIRPTSINIVLNANGVTVARKTLTSTDWTYSFNDLYKYQIGHENDDNYLINYEIKEVTEVQNYVTTYNGYDIINTHIPEVTFVSGTKTWNDNNNQDGIRPDSITVKVFNGINLVTSKTVTKDDNWEYTFDNLPKYENGNEIKYQIKEDEVSGYKTVVTGNNIKNTHTPELINNNTGKLSVEKAWDDNNNQDGLRNAVEITLYADSVVKETVTLNDSNEWKHTFENLAKYNNGKEIVYTVDEKEITGYTKEITGSVSEGFKVTNSHIPELINNNTGKLSVEKAWDDNNNQDGLRKDVEITLYADGEVKETVTLNNKNEWKHTFENLAKYNNGKEIVYTVDEKEITGYTKEITGSVSEGFKVTNTHTPELINDNTGKLSVEKTWDDNNNQDGLRKDVEIKLYADGEVKETVTLNDSNEWKHTFEKLAKYNNGNEIVYTVDEKEITGYTKEITGSVSEGFKVTNSHTPELINNNTGKLNVEKTWDDNNNQDGLRKDVEITLYADGEVKETVTLNAQNEWKHTFEKLAKYNNGNEIVYTVDEKEVTGYTKEITGSVSEGFKVTNSHKPELVNNTGKINVEKTWDDNNNQDGLRKDVEITLYADGEAKETVTLNNKNEWKHTFENLAKYNNGNEIVYTVDEKEVTGYTKSITGSVSEGFKVTNTHTPELINDNTGKLNVEKSWNDNNNQDGLRNAVEITLYADGEVKETVTLNDSNEWKHTFEKLAKYNNGNEIVYTVDEKEITGYTKEITGSVSEGFKVTNSHTPELINNNTGKLNVEKNWDDNNNQDGIRKDVEITLYADGEVKETVTLNESNEWKYTFENLAKKNNGIEIVYTVDEKEITGYTKEITGSVSEGFKVTNSHKPELVNNTGKINVEKTWDDNNNQDGLRKDVEITLYADGEAKETVTLNESNEWKHTFENLAKKNNGIEIVYTVDEKEITGYTKEITGSVSEGFKVTNIHTPEETTVTGRKVWQDANNQDGIRPDSITVKLYADGTYVTEGVITAGENKNWAFAFTNLPKYNNGNEIKYTVEEVSVNGYTTTYGDNNTIINTHEVSKISVSGTKTWDDNDDQDGKRPESIKVRLYANGTEVRSKDVTVSDNWTYSFEDLDEYSNSSKISYTITEDAVEGYTTVVDGYNITNSHTPEKINISGTKTWDDNDDQDGKRPESIKIRLYANGTEVASKDVTIEDEWSYSFDNLDKYASGEEIVYTLTEDSVDGYESNIIDYNITNTHAPEKITFKATKVWDDFDNQDGIRPESITVYLYKNDEVFKTAVISAENNWTYSFEDLDRYAAGEEISYKIVEEEVDGYSTAINYDEIDENNIISSTITNTHTPEKIDIDINKTWDDKDNYDGLRPIEITVDLYKDGVYYDTIIINENDDWKYTIKDLDKYANGKEILYTILEHPVAYYETVINGFDITNTHKVVEGKGSGYEIEAPNTGVDTNNNDITYIIEMIFMILSLGLLSKKALKN